MDLEIWGDLAHVAADHLMQGDHIQVVGKLKKNLWTKKDGTERQDVSISLTKVNRIVNAQQEYGGNTAVSQLLPEHHPKKRDSKADKIQSLRAQGVRGILYRDTSHLILPLARSWPAA